MNSPRICARCLRIAPLLLLLSLAASPASALQIQVDYTATVINVPEELLGGPIEVGDPVTGRLVYDTAIADSFPGDPETGAYPDAVTEFEVTVGSYVAAITAPIDLSVRDDAPSIPSPLDWLVANAQGAVSGGQINGFDPIRLQWSLVSSDTSKLPGDAPPDVATLLAFSPSDGTSSVNFLVFQGVPALRWALDSMSAQVVPEPTAGLLLTLGLAPVAALSRRKR